MQTYKLNDQLELLLNKPCVWKEDILYQIRATQNFNTPKGAIRAGQKGGYATKDLVIGTNSWVGSNTDVQSKSTIGSNTYIGKDTWVQKHTTIGNNVQIGNHVVFGSSVTVEDDATIGNHALISWKTHVHKKATIGAHAKVLIGARIGNRARLKKGVTVQPYATIAACVTVATQQ